MEETSTQRETDGPKTTSQSDSKIEAKKMILENKGVTVSMKTDDIGFMLGK